jgi:glycosyltransferase involved in cell wall biosynthesis
VKIAWLTTYAGRSGIADFSRHVVEALAVEHDVELWVPEATGRLRAPVAPIVRFTRWPLALRRLHTYDAVVYNIGNELPRHRAIAAVARARPGIVVLHDVVLRHFHGGQVVEGTWSPERYLRAIELHDGAEAAAAVAAGRGPGGDLWSAVDTWDAAPLFGEVIAGALGVVTHSTAQAERVRATWAGPVAPLWIPAYPRARPPVTLSAHPPDGPLLLVAVGGLTANRRLEDVVGVLAARPDLARRVRMVVAGDEPDPVYARDLREQIARAGLGEVVRLAGYLPDAALERLMGEAHAFVNLRHPSTEGGSASLMAQLSGRRPVVVYDSGSFRDVPAAAAVKVALGDRERLAAAIERLVDEPTHRDAVAAAGAAWAAERGARRYAAELTAFLAEVAERAPLVSLCDRVGRAVGAGPGAEATIDAASAAIATLMPPDWSS